MRKSAPKIEYTPEMLVAMDEIADIIRRLDELAHPAGLKSFKLRVVWGKGGSIELEGRREWDPNPMPYAAPVEKPKAQPLARPTV